MTRASEFDWRQLQQALEGRYVLERRVGRGGMGVVYSARELRLDRPVAIKVLPPDKAAHPVARERFLSEARTAAQLSHPNIIPIFAVDEIGEIVYYAMALVEGETLGQRIVQHGPLDPPAAVRVLRDIARALAYAHTRGVVHRDIKPDNILLDAATGRALLSDFGIARVGAGSGTGRKEVVGTAEFMSPEQAAGGPVDARSDLYSVGAVGYHALSGRLPFAANDAVGLLMQHLTEPPPPLSVAAPAVPRQLAQVIHRCLAKDPSARFSDAAALAAALALADQHHVNPPVALRAFLTEGLHLSGLAALYALVVTLGAVPLALASLLAAGPAGRLVVGGALLGLLLVPLGVALARVRRLLVAGHDRQDLTDVLRAELARRREELAFMYGGGPSRLERVLRVLAYGGLAAAAATARLALGGEAGAWLPSAFGISAAAALLGAVGARLRSRQRRDRKAERRLRFWDGRVGRWLFALAGLGLPGLEPDRPSPRASSAAVAVGIVGDRFFEALPGTTDP